MSENFEVRLKQANETTKAELADFVKKADFNDLKVKIKKLKQNNYFKQNKTCTS